MQYAVVHESNLLLETGTDWFLELLGELVTVAAIAAFLISPADIWTKFLGTGLCFLAARYIHCCNQRSHQGRLLIFPDGRAKWVDRARKWQDGEISVSAWSISQYAVVRGASCSGTRKFLISRSRQQNESYRILKSWLRLKTW